MNGDDKIVVLKQYSDLTEAELAKNLLVRNGIPAFISNHNGATMLPIPAIRISLHVKENDLVAATALVREWKSNSDSCCSCGVLQILEIGNKKEESCCSCGLLLISEI